jgi:hypothetical protein
LGNVTDAPALVADESEPLDANKAETRKFHIGHDVKLHWSKSSLLKLTARCREMASGSADDIEAFATLLSLARSYEAKAARLSTWQGRKVDSGYLSVATKSAMSAISALLSERLGMSGRGSSMRNAGLFELKLGIAASDAKDRRLIGCKFLVTFHDVAVGAPTVCENFAVVGISGERR